MDDSDQVDQVSTTLRWWPSVGSGRTWVMKKLLFSCDTDSVLLCGPLPGGCITYYTRPSVRLSRVNR